MNSIPSAPGRPRRRSRRSSLRGGVPVVLLALAGLVACGRGADPVQSAVDQRLGDLGDDPHAGGAALPRLALLVGIDEYAPGTSSRFPDLEGCVNDVGRFAGLLADSFGFQPNEIFTLTDGEATHENIVRAFQRVLIERAGPETQAVFFFSGHGSRIPDRSEDGLAEPDRLDSTYLAHDSRAGKLDGERDLSDDELRSLVHALTQRTENVLVVTDSCHSGGGLRGASRLRARTAPPGSRSTDREWLAEIWPEGVELFEDGPGARLSPQSYVHLAACRRNQLAYEIDAGNPVEGVEPEGPSGALTYFLTRQLALATPDQTWRSLADDVAARLAAHVPGQSVTYAGALDRRIFDGEFERVPGFPARAVEGDALSVEAGWLFGLREGSLLTVLDARGDQELGTVEVTAVTGTRSRARWVGETRPTVPEGGLRVVESERGGPRPLSVAVTDEGLRTGLAESALVELHSADDGGALYRASRSQTGELSLHTAEGLRVHPRADSPDDGTEVEDLLESVRREIRWRELVSLADFEGGLPLEVRFRSATAEEMESYPGHRPVEILEDRGDGADGELTGAAGERRVLGAFEDEQSLAIGYFEITNPHDTDLYVHVLSVAEDRFATPIEPAVRGEPAQLLPAGASLPPVPVGLVARRDWPLERPMRDRYLVIGTRDRADFSVFRAEGTMRSGRSGSEPPALLKQAFDGARTRGRAPVETSGWGVAVIDLLVESPAP